MLCDLQSGPRIGETSILGHNLWANPGPQRCLCRVPRSKTLPEWTSTGVPKLYEHIRPRLMWRTTAAVGRLYTKATAHSLELDPVIRTYTYPIIDPTVVASVEHCSSITLLHDLLIPVQHHYCCSKTPKNKQLSPSSPTSEPTSHAFFNPFVSDIYPRQLHLVECCITSSHKLTVCFEVWKRSKPNRRHGRHNLF